MDTYEIGDYIVESKRIGKGSFSKIYKGYHKVTKRVVAVKKIELDDTQKINTNIEREINVMKRLDHPNILKLYDVIYDYENNNIYLIIEYCNNGDFSHFLNKRPLKEKHAKRYMKQLADGLKYLQKYNIMHRDLKPHNILLSSENQIKLSDFGFARYFEKNKMVETLCGSPMYMAPEIMKFREYTNKSDLWSVGIILYETVTGRVPFKAKTFYSLMQIIEKKHIIIPPDITLSKKCIDLLYSLLQKNPQKRISWKHFFHHSWFIDNERILTENQLLCVDYKTTQKHLDLLIKKNEEMIDSFNNLLFRNIRLNGKKDGHEDEREGEREDDVDIELHFEDIIGDCNGSGNSTTLDADADADADADTDADTDADEPDNVENIELDIITNTGYTPNHNCFTNSFGNSPIFNSIKDNSFVIVRTPPSHIIASDTTNNNTLLKNVKGYINSSLSLLKDSINYISGNHSI